MIGNFALNIVMPKKKKRHSPRYSLLKTRKGFYSLVVVTISLMLLTINQYGATNFASDVLGEKDEAKNEDREEEKRKKEEEFEEKKREEEEKREEKKLEIERKYDVNPEKIKIEYKSESATAKTERKIEFKDGEIELEEEFEDKLSKDLEKSFEEIKETEIASDSSSVVIKKNNVKARIGFPLTIDGATNQLIITRPDGTTKAVTVLPDQAVNNFIRNNKVNLINFEDPTGTPSGETETPGTGSATTGEEETQIELVEYNDQLAYEIKGKKKLKLLGLFDITAPTTGYVSAETGDVLAQEESLFTRFLNVLSP